MEEGTTRPDNASVIALCEVVLEASRLEKVLPAAGKATKPHLNHPRRRRVGLKTRAKQPFLIK
jgi:hypothetical protein